MANKIAILNFKGGVGKTTTAINLSAALVQAGKRVLLVDVDAQCDTSKTLDFKEGDGNTLYDAIMDETYQVPTPVYHHRTGIDFVPSSSTMSKAAEIIISRMRREYILYTLLKDVEKSYDYILIDCPPNRTIINNNAMCAADYVIIPVDGGAYATDGMAVLSDYLAQVKKLLNDKIELLGIVFTRHEKNLRLVNHNVEEIESVFPNHTFNTKISKCAKVAESQKFHKTIFEYARYCDAALDYKKMAKEIIEALEPKTESSEQGNN